MGSHTLRAEMGNQEQVGPTTMFVFISVHLSPQGL